MKICLVIGTRPEFIKMSPVIKEIKKQKMKFFLVHTGQHYDFMMSDKFIKDLKLPKPKYHWNDMFRYLTIDWIIDILKKEKPNIVLVEGDTNSVFCGAVAARRLGIKVGHVEAGLRSFDERMIEEHNRVMVDHISDYCFAPTKISVKNLLKEGINPKKIFLVGNTISDSLKENMKKIKIPLDLSLNPFIFVTIHRAENVDNQKILKEILIGIEKIAKKYQLNVIFPIHHRTLKKIKEFKIELPKIFKIVESMSYWDCLYHETSAKLIITDSGGIVEEACILGVPCITVRDKTDRPETCEIGANILAGTKKNSIFKAGVKMMEQNRTYIHPYGTNVAKGIVGILKKKLK